MVHLMKHHHFPILSIILSLAGLVNGFVLTKTTAFSSYAIPGGFHSCQRPSTTAKFSNQKLQQEQQKNLNNIDGTWLEETSETVMDAQRRDVIYNTIAIALLGVSGISSFSLFQTNVYTPPGFTRIPTQFIAALGDPNARSGNNAKDWGIWKLDPGPRGVWLRDYENVLLNNVKQQAPAGWAFDPKDWWLEEHGLIMEKPSFPLPAGRYLVTGGRLVTTGLTIQDNGNWMLDEGSLYDVTHLPCRSARYKPMEGAPIVGSPLTANSKEFPVAPGGVMPSVPGCKKQDYAVLFVVGKAS